VRLARVGMATVGASLGAFALLQAAPALAQYAEIRDLHLSDPVYRQQQSDLQRFYRLAVASDGALQLAFYQYEVTGDDDFLALAARFSLRPETLASLNGLDNPAALRPGSTLLVPNLQAIFVAEQPRTVLEEVMAAWRDDREADANKPGAMQAVVHLVGERRAFLVYPDELFHPIERAYFYRRLFRVPVAEAILSSGYGRRPSPITGNPQFHGGVDLAAPSGEPVLTAQQGVVVAVRSDEILGIHVRVRHAGEFETLYGHLAQAFVSVGDALAAGAPLGTVGSTGLTTGPHLHFEVRRGGQTIDPNQVLPQRITRDQSDVAPRGW
jgi:murein DD-endopeptidase MepM/ murein hydrolase activator NlpD